MTLCWIIKYQNESLEWATLQSFGKAVCLNPIKSHQNIYLNVLAQIYLQAYICAAGHYIFSALTYEKLTLSSAKRHKVLLTAILLATCSRRRTVVGPKPESLSLMSGGERGGTVQIHHQLRWILGQTSDLYKHLNETVGTGSNDQREGFRKAIKSQIKLNKVLCVEEVMCIFGTDAAET